MHRFRSDSRLFRFFVCLLAALQMVAVSWHVCAMGGSSEHCRTASNVGTTVLACHGPDDPTRVWRMAWDAAPETSSPHCLAALLSSTPTQIAQTFRLAPLVEVFAVRCVAVSRGILRIAPNRVFARGPPLS